ncbi:MAG: hypothetical protein ABS916_09775 [Carnobacterium sp.]|uniref:hypothetical protein n=1 Tax=Carnobacterium sp. TaxID=48221 RepID=UPI003314DBEE
MKKWKIYAGSLNEAEYIETFEGTEEQAARYAWECACEDFESYAGLHGTRDITDIMAEENVEWDEAEDIFNDERESWLDYYVIEQKD